MKPPTFRLLLAASAAIFLCSGAALAGTTAANVLSVYEATTWTTPGNTTQNQLIVKVSN